MGEAMKITILCCSYTNLSEREDLYEVPVSLEIKRYPCGGHIEITDMLRSLREGAEAVAVCACEEGTCHNGGGNKRAEKKVLGAKVILQEMGIPPERVSFFYVPRLEAEVFVEDVKALYRKLLELKVKETKECKA